jgi:transposase
MSNQSGMKDGESSMEQTEILLTIRRQLTMLQSTIDSLKEQSRQKDEEIERLRQIILNLQRAQFGQRSEKRTYVLDDGNQQLSLFDTPEKSEEKSSSEPSQNSEREIRVSGHSRKKKRTLEELCASLPVEERIVDLPDEEKVNADGHALTCIGQEYIRTELVLERARAKVVKHYRKVYADRELEQETGYAEVFKPVMPPPLLPHSYASASVVTDVLMKKYVDAMPLYRQEQMWKRMGVELKRGTMANWVIQVADLYLRPFWKRIRSELLTQSTIHADETVMQVLKEKGKPATSESRMWVYSSAKRADIQLRCFEYRESRSGKWAKTFLEGFSGVLITDGYSGYNKVQEAERAGCWAHMRRKWLEAMPEGADAKTCKAAEGYEFCNRLFELEHQFEELTAEERLIQRKEKSGPVLEAYWKWLNTIARPTGKLKDAVTYAQNQKAHLSAFLEHGEIEISNNQVENAIRPFVIGRKGWLFADTPQGAEASAIIYSLMETAKANSLRLDDYLLHLLSVLPERAEQDKDFEMDDLLPWSEEMKSWFSAV